MPISELDRFVITVVAAETTVLIAVVAMIELGRVRAPGDLHLREIAADFELLRSIGAGVVTGAIAEVCALTACAETKPADDAPKSF